MLAPSTLTEAQLNNVLNKKAPKKEDEKHHVTEAVLEQVTTIISHSMSTRERFHKMRAELKRNPTYSSEACYRLIRNFGDKNEGVSKADMEAFLRSHGHWISTRSLETLFNFADGDDDHLIGREELFKLLDGSDLGESSSSSGHRDWYSFERYLDQKYPLTAGTRYYYDYAPSYYYRPYWY